MELEEELINAIISGEVLPPERWILDNGVVRPKTEEEILADDWNTSIERRAEYTNYLMEQIHEMELYLTETDWYVTRKMETLKDIPEDIHNTRVSYREKISEFRDLLSVSKFD